MNENQLTLRFGNLESSPAQQSSYYSQNLSFTFTESGIHYYADETDPKKLTNANKSQLFLPASP
jgi:hypothetical protein